MLHDYRARVVGILAVQDTASGLWHQVLNETRSYLETSATAMNVLSMAVGVENGWLATGRKR